MNALPTGAHIKRLITVSTIATPHKYRVTCSCGSFKHEPVTRAHADILHGAHLDAVMNDALDQITDGAR